MSKVQVLFGKLDLPMSDGFDANIISSNGFPSQWVLKSNANDPLAAEEASKLLRKIEDKGTKLDELTVEDLNILMYLGKKNRTAPMQEATTKKIVNAIRAKIMASVISDATNVEVKLTEKLDEGLGTGTTMVDYMSALPCLTDKTISSVIISLVKLGKTANKAHEGKCISIKVNDGLLGEMSLPIYMPKPNDANVKSNTITYARVMRAWGQVYGNHVAELSNTKPFWKSEIIKFITPIGLNAGVVGLINEMELFNAPRLKNIIAMCLPKFKIESFHQFEEEDYLNLLAFAMVVDAITAVQKNLKAEESVLQVQFFPTHLQRAKSFGFDETKLSEQPFKDKLRRLASNVTSIGTMSNMTAKLYSSVIENLTSIKRGTFEVKDMEQGAIDRLLKNTSLGKKANKDDGKKK